MAVEGLQLTVWTLTFLLYYHPSLVLGIATAVVEPTPLASLANSNTTRCRLSEYLCDNRNCVPINSYCDGYNDCGDSSDEPRYCTRCNRTYYGDVGRTYSLEIHRPREDALPYICFITLTAAGGVHGDLVQILFDSFTLGRFESFTSDGCPDGYLQITEAGRPQVGGSWCGTSWGPTMYFSEMKTITLIIRLLRLSKDQNNYNFDFRMEYKVLRREHSTVRFGGHLHGLDNPSNKAKPFYAFANSTRDFETNSIQKSNTTPEYYLGDLISGTYCSRIFSDCDTKLCRLQSPNFPGVYPRNLTCYYAVRQHVIPQGKHALIVVKQANGQLVSIRSQAAVYPQAQEQDRKKFRELKVWSQCDEVQDYVAIYDGYTTRDPVILKFCGGGVGVPEAISSGPELLVEFTTSPFGTFLHPSPFQSLHGFQLDVEIRFVDQNSPLYSKNKRTCEFWIRSTGKGVLENPQHSIPPNTTCLYHLQGIETSLPPSVIRTINYPRRTLGFPYHSPRFRVWFSVLKFHVTNALNPNLPEDEYCGSHLNIWDGPLRVSPGCSDIFCDKERSIQMSRATSPQTVLVGRPPSNATLIARYCKERAPRTCEQALLSSQSLSCVPPRPCTKGESFLSRGDSLTLELKLTQSTTLKPVKFKALYEFVDLHQDGEPWGKGPCSRRFVSRTPLHAPPEAAKDFGSPKDVFLYGRGGNTNISCVWRFEGGPHESIRIRLWSVRFKERHCRSVISRHTARSSCHRAPNKPLSAAVRLLSLPWSQSGPSVLQACFCSSLPQRPYEFTSEGPIAEIKFDVFMMNATEDFDDYGFEGSFEFIRLDTGCNREHRLSGKSGELRLGAGHYPSEEIECERKPWLIDPAPGHFLYVQTRGVILNDDILSQSNTSSYPLTRTCATTNRILIHVSSSEVIVVCPEPLVDRREEVVGVFSEGWHGRTNILTMPPAPDEFHFDKPRAISVEYIGQEIGFYSVSWLELSKKGATSSRTVYSVSEECLYRCPDIDACIDSSLWCDGVDHCPSGYDERLIACSIVFRLPAQHSSVVAIAAAVALVVIVLAGYRRCKRYKKSSQRIQRLKSLSSGTGIFDEKEVIC